MDNVMQAHLLSIFQAKVFSCVRRPAVSYLTVSLQQEEQVGISSLWRRQAESEAESV